MRLIIGIKFVLASLAALLACSTLVFGADCQVKVTGSDAMQYDVKKIEISKDFEPNMDKINILLKRYKIWKELYSTNKKIASSLLT